MWRLSLIPVNTSKKKSHSHVPRGPSAELPAPWRPLLVPSTTSSARPQHQQTLRRRPPPAKGDPMTVNIPSLRCCGDGPRIQQQRPKPTRGIDTDATNDRHQGRRRHLHRRATPIVPLPPIFHQADRDRAKPCPRISCGGGQVVTATHRHADKYSCHFFNILIPTLFYRSCNSRTSSFPPLPALQR